MEVLKLDHPAVVCLLALVHNRQRDSILISYVALKLCVFSMSQPLLSSGNFIISHNSGLFVSFTLLQGIKTHLAHVCGSCFVKTQNNSKT